MPGRWRRNKWIKHMPEPVIVGANGVPLNTIGWSAPIVEVDGQCFLMGGSARHSVPAPELPGMAEQGYLTLLKPVPVSKVLPGYSAVEGIDRDLRGPLALDCYILYLLKKEVAKVELDLGLEFRIEAECQKHGLALQRREDNRSVFFCAIATDRLRHLMSWLSDVILPGLRGLLKSQIGKNAPDRGLLLRADRVAEFLFQLATDEHAAREAIALRSLTTVFDRGIDLCWQWTFRVAEEWGLPTTESFWRERLGETIHGLWVERKFSEAVYDIDKERIASGVSDASKEWSIKTYQPRAQQRAENKITESIAQRMSPIKGG